MRLSLIVAMSRNRCIGVNNQLPWHLPADLQYFKKMTLNKPVIMGRKTHESIGFPLPKRRNIVLSRDTGYSTQGCEVLHSLEAALTLLADETEVMVIGGATIYQQALALADTLYVTQVDTELEGDAYFPAWTAGAWNQISSEAHPTDPTNTLPYCFQTYQRN